MRGPTIIARTMSIPHPVGSSGIVWQYHSRSDRHSKVACWAVMFDLLSTSSLLKQHVATGKVSLAINRQMNNFQTGQRKNLDLVVARATESDTGPAVALDELADRYDLQLSQSDRALLDELPASPLGTAGSTVLVALEAKACMTAHGKAGPRLFDELSSSHATVHGDNNNALAVGFAMVNYADKFISPVGTTNIHNQPAATVGVIKKLREINRRSGPQSGQPGFDAFGILVVELENDGSPMHVVTKPPAPQSNDDFFYDRMIVRTAHLYDANFGHV